MTTHAPGLIGTQPSHRTTKLIWFALVAVALAIALAVTIVSLATTNDSTQTGTNVVATAHKAGHKPVLDCRPTRVVHFC